MRTAALLMFLRRQRGTARRTKFELTPPGSRKTEAEGIYYSLMLLMTGIMKKERTRTS